MKRSSSTGKELRGGADAARRTRAYGPVVETLKIEAAGQAYQAEIRYGRGRNGQREFSGYCLLQAGEGDRADEIVLVHAETGDAVAKKLREEVLRKVDVAWAPFIYVEVADGGDSWSPNAEARATFEVSFSYLLLGTRPDGSKCYREGASISERESDAPIGEWYSHDKIQDGRPLVGPDTRFQYRDGGMTRSLLPYDAKVAEQLTALIQRLEDLREAVRALLTVGTPESIISSIRGLPAVGVPVHKLLGAPA